MKSNESGSVPTELFIGVLLIGLLILLFSACRGCAPNYSKGSRIGVVNKLSEKGVVWKSYEGELLMSLPPGMNNIQPEKFEFNVSPEAVDQVTAAMKSGRRVELFYHEWWIGPVWIDSSHVVVRVEVVE